MWNAKQKRCYQRIMSGISYANAGKRVIRFLTLTSSPGSVRDIQTDFRVLKMRLIRKYGKFDYIKIRTNEGYGVLHILCIGGFIPQVWLSRNWKEIHQSPIVDIRATSTKKGLGKYVVSQYLSDQRCSFLRYSWSWGWVYRGFVKNWKLIAREHFFDGKAIYLWNRHLGGDTIKLDGKYLKPPPDVCFVTFEQSTLVSFFTSSQKIPAFFVRLYAKCDWI